MRNGEEKICASCGEEIFYDNGTCTFNCLCHTEKWDYRKNVFSGCPFCSSNDLNINLKRIDGFIECNSCGCRLPLPEKGPPIQINYWNRRFYDIKHNPNIWNAALDQAEKEISEVETINKSERWMLETAIINIRALKKPVEG